MKDIALILIVCLDGFLVSYVCSDMQRINKRLNNLENKDCDK